MRSIALACTLVLLAGALAGCMGEPSEGVTKNAKQVGARAAKTVNKTAIEDRINRSIAVTGNPELSDWLVLRGSASPEGNVTGFRFNVPMGAIQQAAPPFFFGGHALALEIAPIVVAGEATITEWVLLTFVLDQGRLRLVGDNGFGYSFFGTQWRMEAPGKRDDYVGPSPQSAQIVTSTAPSYLVLQDQTFTTDSPLFFALGAKSTQPVEFGVALRMLDHRPTPSQPPAPSLDLFLERFNKTIPFGLPVTGRGVGLQLARYTSETNLATNASRPAVVKHEDIRTESVQVTDRLSVRNVPTVNVRDHLLASRFEATEGWSFAAAEYFPWCATGKWSATLELHGKKYNPHNLISYHPICSGIYPWIAEAVLLGSPEFVFYNDGMGGSSFAFDIQVANLLMETLAYTHIGLGARLPTLFGHTGIERAYVGYGLAGPVPPGAAASLDTIPK